jgi:hypothetical protein
LRLRPNRGTEPASVEDQGVDERGGSCACVRKCVVWGTAG